MPDEIPEHECRENLVWVGSDENDPDHIVRYECFHCERWFIHNERDGTLTVDK